MRLTRVHVDQPLAPGAVVALPEAAAAHLARVLRLGLGDACVLFNGDGRDYRARLLPRTGRTLSAEIVEAAHAAAESSLELVLAQGVARGEKMDWVLQKATELGVAGIVPLLSERVEVRLDAERGARRLAHWHGVVVAACEQCGRARLPKLEPPRPLAEWAAARPDTALGLFLDPAGERVPATLTPPAVGQPVLLAVGPEGGFSERERTLLRAAGFAGLRLGPRILRTETAGLAALAVLQSRLGDLG